MKAKLTIDQNGETDRIEIIINRKEVQGRLIIEDGAYGVWIQKDGSRKVVNFDFFAEESGNKIRVWGEDEDEPLFVTEAE